MSDKRNAKSMEDFFINWLKETSYLFKKCITEVSSTSCNSIIQFRQTQEEMTDVNI